MKKTIGEAVICLLNSLADLLKPRTLFTIMFFGTTIYIMILKQPIPELLKTFDISLLAFYFGEKSTKYKKNKENK